MALRFLADVAFHPVWLSMRSVAVSVSGHSFNFSFPAHTHWSPVLVIMTVVRLYQRDKYYQSDRINPFNRCVDLSPKFRQRIRNTIFSEWRLVSWDRWDGRSRVSSRAPRCDGWSWGNRWPRCLGSARLTPTHRGRTGNGKACVQPA